MLLISSYPHLSISFSLILFPCPKIQSDYISQIQDILKFSGVLCDISDKDISVSKGAIVKKLVVYPAMWKVSPDDSTVYVSDSLLKYAKPYAVEEIIKNL